MNEYRKFKKSIKKRLVVTFVIGTIIANFILAVIGGWIIRKRIEYIREKFGNDYRPSGETLILHLLVLTIVVVVVLGIALYSKLYRDIVSPLNALSAATKRIAEGDLDFTVKVSKYNDEIAALGEDFEEMRKRLSESARKQLKNEEESKQLISNITHDLKTPITTIKGYAEGLLDGIADTAEKREKYLRTIYNKSTQLDSLLNELTYYTNIDQSRIPYEFLDINVYDYFADCVEEIDAELQAKGFEMVFNCNISKSTIVKADPTQFKKVINNIIGNSVKYGRKEGGRIELKLSETDTAVKIDFRDNGKGIKEEELPNIFKRFYRADASRSSATGGSGIGLSIVKKIVEDHGGRIWAESVFGEGTTMHIELNKQK